MLRMRFVTLVLVVVVLGLSLARCSAQPERFGLPERLTDLTVLGDIVQRSDLSPFDHTEILVTWLVREYRNPSPTSRGLGGPIDSGWIQFNIMGTLFVKGDPVTIAEIAADPQAEPALRDAMHIVLGMKGDSSQRAKLITILQINQNPYYRASAAEALGMLGATEAIPVLEVALSDNYGVEVWEGEGSQGTGLIYPVRQRAAESLRMLRNPELVSASRARIATFQQRLAEARTVMVDLTTQLRSNAWQITWRNHGREVVAVNSQNNLRARIGNGYAVVNNCKMTLSAPPVLRDRKVLVPQSISTMLQYRAAPLARLAKLPNSAS